VDNLYIAHNGAMPTTAALVAVTTGTAIKTMLQLATPSTTDIRIVEWGFSFDGTPNAVTVELIQADTAATVTAHVAAGVQPLNDPNAPPSKLTLGASATGYTSSSETAPTVTRYLDGAKFFSGNTYEKVWPLGHEPRLPISKFARIRVTAAAAVNMRCYMIWREG
jgi:hypothetical protein